MNAMQAVLADAIDTIPDKKDLLLRGAFSYLLRHETATNMTALAAGAISRLGRWSNHY